MSICDRHCGGHWQEGELQEAHLLQFDVPQWQLLPHRQLRERGHGGRCPRHDRCEACPHQHSPCTSGSRTDRETKNIQDYFLGLTWRKLCDYGKHFPARTTSAYSPSSSTHLFAAAHISTCSTNVTIHPSMHQVARLCIMPITGAAGSRTFWCKSQSHLAGQQSAPEPMQAYYARTSKYPPQKHRHTQTQGAVEGAL